ncbi:LuxR C-terminal-related transcriptional regulator [Thermoflavimicrobium dichotomicum]|uniref:LuxR C-terminal-related transcriptional regulator n=1 Tax=Thermoflavimicrobium dichotomicum TaxID=46223 RepID=UPI001587025B|nr:response regulator transcription factor [Thermoflavimicrobium dichotomicum]
MDALVESHVEAVDNCPGKHHTHVNPNIRVLIADQDPHFRKKIKSAVANEKDMVLVGECNKGIDVPYLCKQVLPHLVIMDLYLPHSNSVEVTYRICQMTPQTKVLILSDQDDPYVLETIRSGASGFLLKNIDCKQMMEAIRMIAYGGVYIHPIMMGRIVNELRRLSRKEGIFAKVAPYSWQEILTYREMEVLRLMSQGKNNRSISEQLFISEKTVKNHVSKILYKLNVQDRTQAVILAIKYGWVPLI